MLVEKLLTYFISASSSSTKKWGATLILIILIHSQIVDNEN